jgi:hypothetical protein
MTRKGVHADSGVWRTPVTYRITGYQSNRQLYDTYRGRSRTSRRRRRQGELNWNVAPLRAWYIQIGRPVSLRIDDKSTRSKEFATFSNQTSSALGINNNGAIDMAKSGGPMEHTNLLEVKHHYLQEQVEAGTF